MRRLTAHFLPVPVFLLLAACATQPAAPVTEHSSPRNEHESGYRVVIPGDTLYSIAWEAGQDYKEVASWNGIAPPYRLLPGQRLRLSPPVGPIAKADARKPAAKARGTHVRPVVPRKPAVTAQRPGTAKPSTTAPRVANKTGVAKPNTAKPSGPKRRTPTKSGSWVWPTNGKLLNYRTPSGVNKGLDIAGTRGEAIRAAASGRVVYIGNGLRGYGLLVILKHNDAFLSAYAHSEKVYVREGDMIKAGQKIADMGSSGTDRVKLHFEIRRRGVPVDPLLYLPKK